MLREFPCGRQRPGYNGLMPEDRSKTPPPFVDYCSRVEEHLRIRYGIPVVTRDIPDPLTGDLDGSEIHIDYAVTPEQRFFLLAHLFGHTVQWNVDPDAFSIGKQQPPVSEEFLPPMMEYERSAARYGLQMLHEIGITDTDQWFSDYTACDRAYLLYFYRTGRKGEFQSFWQDGTPLVEPQWIPPFVPFRRTFRMDGVVI
jgi:hypothetical protein